MLAALGFLTITASASAKSVRLDGTVLDAETKEPVSGATVIAASAADPETTTNLEGRFSLELPAAAAETDIVIIAEGYVRLAVLANATGPKTSVSLELTPSESEGPSRWPNYLIDSHCPTTH